MWGQQGLGFKSGSALKLEINGEALDFTSLSLSGLIFPILSRG